MGTNFSTISRSQITISCLLFWKKILYSYSAFFPGNMAGTWHAILRASKIRLRTNKLIIYDLLWVEQAFTELKLTFYFFFSLENNMGQLKGKTPRTPRKKVQNLSSFETSKLCLSIKTIFGLKQFPLSEIKNWISKATAKAELDDDVVRRHRISLSSLSIFENWCMLNKFWHEK